MSLPALAKTALVLLSLNFNAVFSDSPTPVDVAPTSQFDTTFPYGGEAARTLAGNDESECYVDSTVGIDPFRQRNGTLRIFATRANPKKPNPCGLPYNSGMLSTYSTFSQTYGYFEAEIKMPAGAGLGSSGFWLLPVAGYNSELDVFENLGASPTTIYSSVHGCYAQLGPNCQWNDPSWWTNFNTLSVSAVSARFHTYGVDWEPATTTYFVDGKQTLSIPTPMSMNQPMYMIFNLAVGGSGGWAGSPPPNAAFPALMQIRAVRAYSTAGTTFVSTAASKATH